MALFAHIKTDQTKAPASQKLKDQKNTSLGFESSVTEPSEVKGGVI